MATSGAGASEGSYITSFRKAITSNPDLLNYEIRTADVSFRIVQWKFIDAVTSLINRLTFPLKKGGFSLSRGQPVSIDEDMSKSPELVKCKTTLAMNNFLNALMYLTYIHLSIAADKKREAGTVMEGPQKRILLAEESKHNSIAAAVNDIKLSLLNTITVAGSGVSFPDDVDYKGKTTFDLKKEFCHQVYYAYYYFFKHTDIGCDKLTRLLNLQKNSRSGKDIFGESFTQIQPDEQMGIVQKGSTLQQSLSKLNAVIPKVINFPKDIVPTDPRFAELETRLRILKTGRAIPATWDELVARLAALKSDFKNDGSGGSAAGGGGGGAAGAGGGYSAYGGARRKSRRNRKARKTNKTKSRKTNKSHKNNRHQ